MVTKHSLFRHLLAVAVLLSVPTTGEGVCVVRPFAKTVKRIQGQVLGCDSEACWPLLHATVSAIGSGHRAATSVDEDGHFALDGLPAGHYLLRAEHHTAVAMTASIVLKAASPKAREKYEVSFVLGWDENKMCYGGSVRLVKACVHRPIRVDEVKGRVVTGSPGREVPLAESSVVLTRVTPRGKDEVARVETDEGGRFAFEATPPGSYWLSADDPTFRRARVEITMTGSNSRLAPRDIVFALGTDQRDEPCRGDRVYLDKPRKVALR